MLMRGNASSSTAIRMKLTPTNAASHRRSTLIKRCTPISVPNTRAANIGHRRQTAESVSPPSSAWPILVTIIGMVSSVTATGTSINWVVNGTRIKGKPMPSTPFTTPLNARAATNPRTVANGNADIAWVIIPELCLRECPRAGIIKIGLGEFSLPA
jgi:hypothetical protein